MSLLCRLCLCSIRNKRRTPMKNEQLRAMMDRVFSFVIADEEHFPGEVCWKCFCWVRDFSWFSQRVQAVQQLLNREYIFGNTSLSEAVHAKPEPTLGSADDTENENGPFDTFQPPAASVASLTEDDTFGQYQLPTKFYPDVPAEDEEQIQMLDGEPVMEVLEEENDYGGENSPSMSDLDSVVKMRSVREINTFTDIESLVETEHATEMESATVMEPMPTAGDYTPEGDILAEFEIPCDADTQIQILDEENVPAEQPHGTRPTRTFPIVPASQLPRNEHDSDALIKQFLDYKCELCPNAEKQKIFDTFYELRIHYEEEHDTPGFMRCCNRKFHRRNWLKEHINHHRGVYRCKTCDKVFCASRTLRWHEENMHKDLNWVLEPEERPYACDECGYTCTNPKSLTSHKQRHKKKPCPVCNNIYNANSLKTHMAHMHQIGEILICEMCGHKSYSKQSMERHKVLHHADGSGATGKYVVTCPHCGRGFQRPERLKAHIIYNHTQKGQAYQCDICGRNSPNSRALYEHKSRVHSDKQFPCEYCGKVFTRKLYLRDHLSTHTGIRRYECKLCNVKYSSRGNIANHRKKKHPELVLLRK